MTCGRRRGSLIKLANTSCQDDHSLHAPLAISRSTSLTTQMSCSTKQAMRRIAQGRFTCFLVTLSWLEQSGLPGVSSRSTFSHTMHTAHGLQTYSLRLSDLGNL